MNNKNRPNLINHDTVSEDVRVNEEPNSRSVRIPNSESPTANHKAIGELIYTIQSLALSLREQGG